MKLQRLGLYVSLSIGMAILCAPATGMAAKLIVKPGDSIQQAVDNASPGDKIIVLPGTYQETHGGENAVTVNKDGIRLIARVGRRHANKVVLVPGPGQTNGIVVEPPPGGPNIEGFRLRGFTVMGFSNLGIVTRYVNDFTIEKNESIDNKENGIFPTLSANGLVRRNISYGSDDSALWVEGSVNVRVLRNVTHSSVTGIEVTVSDDIVVKHNESYNNAVGIGLYHPEAASLPPLAQMADWRVEHNYVHDNNRPSTAPPGEMAAEVPAGGGMLILGIDDSVIRHNRIENNDFYGIALVDYCIAMAGTSFACTLFNPPEVDPVPNNNRFVRNVLTNNGTAPPPSHPMASLASDIVVVIFAPDPGNCFHGNTYATSFPLSLPGCS